MGILCMEVTALPNHQLLPIIACRRFLRGFIALLVIAVCWGSWASAQSPPPATSGGTGQSTSDDSIDELARVLARIIDTVREQEQRYRDLEYVVRQEQYFRADLPIGPITAVNLVDGDEPLLPPADMEETPRIVETSHVIHQGELISFEQDRTSFTAEGEQTVYRRESAFDGERTVSVEHGNSVNLHLGRYEASQVLPPHVWGMLSTHVNLPLSVYLVGREELEQHPKVRKARGGGFTTDVQSTTCQPLGTVVVNNLNCEKVRVFHSRRDESAPMIHDLWLAIDRNHLCVKAEVLLDIDGAETVLSETTVNELREIAPGLWMPSSVTTTGYDFRWLWEGQRHVKRITKLQLEFATTDVNHPSEKFQLAVPEDLPVFTIDSEGLVDSPHHPHAAENESDTSLNEIINAIQSSEDDYRSLDVTVTSHYVHLNSIYHAAEGATGYPFSRKQDRIALIPTKGFWLNENLSQNPDGTWRTEKESMMGDVSRRSPLLPHNWFDYPAKNRLSDYLKQDQESESTYEGDDLIDGLLCHRVRRDNLRQGGPPMTQRYFWICPERNYVPLRVQWKEKRWSDRMPTGIDVISKFRELEPGVWFPIRWTHFACNAHDGTGLAENRMIINWRRDCRVTDVTLDPQIDITPPQIAPVDGTHNDLEPSVK